MFEDGANIKTWGLESWDLSILEEALSLGFGPSTAVALLLRIDDGGSARIVTGRGGAPPGDSREWDRVVTAARVEDECVDRDGSVFKVLQVPGFATAALVVESESADIAEAQLAPVAVHIAALLEQVIKNHERRRVSDALVEIGMQIQSEELNVDGVLNTVVTRTREITMSDVCWLALADDERGCLQLKVAAGARTPEFENLWTSIGRGVGGIAVTEARTLFVPDQREYDAGMSQWAHGVLSDEGLVSLLCAPILDRGRVVGALYIGMRERSSFASQVQDALVALSTQAAVAIRNARLYAELMDRNRALEGAEAVHRRLTNASLAGVGLQQLVDEVAAIVGRSVRLILSEANEEDVVSTDADDDDVKPRATAVPVVAGSSELGALVAAGPEELSATNRRALEHGATVIALELVKRQATMEVEWRLHGELLGEMLAAEDGPSDRLRERASRAGVDLTVPRAIVLMAPRAAGQLGRLLDLVHAAVGRSHSPDELMVAQQGAHVALAVRPHGEGSVKKLAVELQARAAALQIRTDVAVSAPDNSLAVALRQASACLALVPSTGKPTLIDYRALGPLRFVLDAPDHTEMRELVTQLLEPLTRPGSNAQLLETLEVYLNHGGHNVRTAAACHIHVSTLKYRLSRISELLNVTLTDPQTRFRLMLAFEVRGILQLLDLDPLH